MSETAPADDGRLNTLTIRRPSRWRWVRRAALSVGITLAVYFAWLLASREWTKREGERELAAAIAEAERDDPDWTWEKLNAARPRPAPGRNGAELIPQIKKLTHADFGKELAKGEWAPRLEVPANIQYSPLVIAEARRDLATSAEAVKLARTLKDYPTGHREYVLTPNVLDTLLPDVQHTRDVVNLLRWDVVLAAEDGDTKRAAADLLASLNASRSIGDETFLISQLVRMAIRSITVRSTEWLLAQVTDAPSLRELQTALAADAEEPLLMYGLRGERAGFDRLFENLYNGTAFPAKALDWSMDSPWSKFSWWHYRPLLLADRANYLNWLNTYVECARLPIYEQPTAFASIPEPTKDPKRILSSLLLPAVNKVAHAHWRTTAEERCAVAGIACERFRQKQDRWPNDLAELAPAFLAAVPLDPYDGQPLRYQKLDDGVLVHSVGTIPQSSFVGKKLAHFGLPDGIEIGFRLWNPDQRRLPPRPDVPEPEQEP